MNVIILSPLCCGLLDSLFPAILPRNEKFVFRREFFSLMGKKRFRVCRNFYWADLLKHAPEVYKRNFDSPCTSCRDVIVCRPCMRTVQIGRTLNSCQISRRIVLSVLRVKVARFIRKNERRLRSS